MITVKLLGGLGNQMFQLAFAMALENNAYEVQLDRSALVERTHREYSLDCFGAIHLGVETGPRLTEQGMRFKEGYLNPPDPVTMVGYWQSEKYFKHIARVVRQRFSFRKPLSRQRPEVSEIWDKIYRSNSIAVHVRRQDYVNLQAFHGMPSIEYYHQGIKYIRERIQDPRVFVFSDDREWCYDNFPKDFTVVRGTDKYEDLQLMSACDHAVIANSSFGWWGAWLQQKLGGIVVAPKQWFAEPSVDSSDIVPERWIKL
jgi:hypothetical protein